MATDGMLSSLNQCLSQVAADPTYYSCVLASGMFNLPGSLNLNATSSFCPLKCVDMYMPSSSCCTSVSAIKACTSLPATATCRELIEKNFVNPLRCGISAENAGLIAFAAIVVSIILMMVVLSCMGKKNSQQNAQLNAVLSKWERFAHSTMQIRNLVWKNVRIMRRHPAQLIFEQCLPLILTGGLVVIVNLDAITGSGTNFQQRQLQSISCQSISFKGSSLKASFYTSGQPAFGLFFLICYLKFVSSMTSRMVIEKETKIIEVMKMMGLKNGPLLLSWYMTGFIQYTPLALLMATELKFGRVFPSAEFATLFFFFWSFSWSIISFAYLIGAFFNKSKTAAIASVLVWIVAFFPFYGVQNKSSVNKYFASFAAPTAFAHGISYLVQDAQRQGNFLANSMAPVNEVPISTMTLFLIVDSILMLAFGWYFYQVIPQDYGVTKPVLFLFDRNYWSTSKASSEHYSDEIAVLETPKSTVPSLENVFTDYTQQTPLHNNVNRTDDISFDDGNNSDTMDNIMVEPPSQLLLAKERNGECIQIVNLRKTFKTQDGDKTAVQNLNLTLYSGQITALLGHNGAGKTTTISMLTGLIPPSSGDAYMFNKSITKDMDQLRQSMGVCPQHDVLYDELTVYEHLLFFGTLKNISSADLSDQVESMISEVGLTEKTNVISKKLSGGQKRKLSVAIALIGESRVVFLDEPTSGMDPYSRRFTWNILQRNRDKRVIILTTHFMDEADLLGDRIAIMSEGQLCCVGSSLFLKKKYGAGYNLTIVKKKLNRSYSNTGAGRNTTSTSNAGGFDIDKLTTFVKKCIDTEKVNILSHVGSEIVFQLPHEASMHFPVLFANLDANLNLFMIEEYGISVTTLEEVFLRIAHDRNATRPSEELRTWRQSLTNRNGPNNNNNGNGSKYDESRLQRPASFLQQYQALVQKRFRCSKRDKKGIIFTIVIPIIFLCILAALPSISVSSYLPAYQLGNLRVQENYKNCKNWFNETSVASNPQYSDCAFGKNRGTACATLCQDAEGVSCSSERCSNVGNVIFSGDSNSIRSSFPYCPPRNDNFVQRAAQFECETTWYSFCSLGIIDCDAKQCCSGLVDDSPYYPCSKCVGNSWPCPSGKCMRKDDAKLQGLINTFLASLTIVIAFAFVPAAIVVFIVKEKATNQNAKHQQLVSGTRISAYWMSLWTHDILLLLVPIGVAIGLLPLYSSFRSDFTSLSGALALFASHVLSMVPLTYLFSFRFQKHSTAQTAVLVFCLITGALFSIFSFLCRLINFRLVQGLTLSDLDTMYLRWVYLLFPGYALYDGLFQIGMRKFSDESSSCLNKLTCWKQNVPGCCTPGVFDFDIAGRSVLYGVSEAILFSLLVLYVDGRKKSSDWSRQQSVKESHFSATNSGNQNSKLVVMDKDVVDEANRVKNGGAANDNIVIKKLRKQYGKEKIALHDLSMGIPRGECFGYLGINGAGKTTTLKILNGGLAPTSGFVSLGGHDLSSDLKAARQLIGYCPQFDALHDHLTVYEELELYAKLKGIRGKRNIEEVVKSKIVQFGLQPFENKLTRGLSGGNKRKVSAAIALIGNPQILFLDEPSTGMDPAARRQMWDVIVEVCARGTCSVILTTHSMEECQALCTRIGILVSGRLRCLGTAQHLKERFGRGYTVEIKLNAPTIAEIETIENRVVQFVYDKQIARENLLSLCQYLNAPSRYEIIMNGYDNGWVLQHYLETESMIPIDVFCTWWIGEDASFKLKSFIQHEFKDSQLVENHGDHYRFQIPKTMKLARMFSNMENMKTRLRIEQYSVSDTTLEEIFNGMAAAQDEEQEPVHGLVREQHLAASSLQAVRSFHRKSSLRRSSNQSFQQDNLY